MPTNSNGLVITQEMINSLDLESVSKLAEMVSKRQKDMEREQKRAAWEKAWKEFRTDFPYETYYMDTEFNCPNCGCGIPCVDVYELLDGMFGT
jgi:hypothetical protein